MINAQEVADLLPQKAPFKFIDTVIEITGDKIVCDNVFPIDSFFFKGHFPGKPITPGVLLVESMAQSVVLFFKSQENVQLSEDVYLCKIENVAFKHVVEPDETIFITSSIKRKINNFVFLSSEITNKKGKVVAKGDIVVSV